MKTHKKKVFEDTYLQVIEEHSQFEHIKSTSDIIYDIFKHTDQKVDQNLSRVTKMYNSRAGLNMEPATNMDLKFLL